MKSGLSLVLFIVLLTAHTHGQKIQTDARNDFAGSGEVPGIVNAQEITGHWVNAASDMIDIAHISHWPFQEPYSSFTTYYESFPVVLGNGSLMFIWASRYRDSLYASKSTDQGNTWSAPSFVAPSSYYCSSLYGIRTASGRIIAVWQSSNGSLGLAMCYSDNDGLSWSAPVSIVMNTVNRYTTISQTMDGKLWLFYSRSISGSGQDIFYRTSTNNGTSWSSEFIFAATVSTEYYGAVVSIDTTTVMAVYTDNSSGSTDVYSRTSVDGGNTWGSPTALLNTSVSETRPRPLRQADGTLWLIYQQGVVGTGGLEQSEIAYIKSTNGGISWDTPTWWTSYAGYDGWANACLKENQPFVTFVSYRWNTINYQTHLWYGLIGTSTDDSPPPSLYPVARTAPSHNTPMHVLAIVDDESGIANVTASYHENGTPYGPVPLYDNGLHDDSLAGDNRWGAYLGPFQAGDIVDFSINVEDIDANDISVYMGSFEIPTVHNVGDVILSFKSNSQLGQQGVGSQQSAFWNGHDYLYMGGLWVGCSINSQPRVSQLHYSQSDWFRTAGTPYTTEPGISDQDGNVVYDDQFSASPIQLRVHQQSFQWSGIGRNDFIIFKYTITNTGTSGTLDGLFVGTWMDPDVTAQTIPNDDRVGYDSLRHILYAYDSQANPGGYYGVQLLGNAPHTVFTYANGQDAQTDDLRYLQMTSGNVTVPSTNADWRLLLTALPFALAVNDSASVTFGIVLGNGLSELQANADTMAAIFNSLLTDVREPLSEVAPSSLELRQNHPNPFNPSTVIGYQLPAMSRVQLKIYNLLGQEVRTLVNGTESAGFKSVVWDGRDEYGRQVSSGIYLYRLQAGNFVRTRKMMLLK